MADDRDKPPTADAEPPAASGNEGEPDVPEPLGDIADVAEKNMPGRPPVTLGRTPRR